MDIFAKCEAEGEKALNELRITVGARRVFAKALTEDAGEIQAIRVGNTLERPGSSGSVPSSSIVSATVRF